MDENSFEENGSPNPRIEKLFHVMARKKASDLHLKNNQPPLLRIGGSLLPLKSEPLTDKQITRLGYELLTPKMQETFEREGSLDFAREFGEGFRTRINIYRQRGHVSMACRLVTSTIPSLQELNLPESLNKIAEFPQGLILVVGPTGTGKSTTLAAMIQHINSTRRCHILTVEDPIEYSYKDDKAVVSQREIGIDVPNWLDALKFAMREDPDVILVGEMRDPETFNAGLTAAETGHLVFGTLHASNVTQAFSRILEMFPSEREASLRQGLSANLRAIIAQMLFPSCKDGVSVVPAVEIMICNSVIRNLLAKGEENKIIELIRSGESEGMQAMTTAIAKLVQSDMVLRRDALEQAPNRERLDMALRGINVDVGKIIG